MPAGPRDDRGGGAEEFARSRQYDYRANSTLVLTAENRSRDPREPTGEPETLAGKKMFKFGDKVQREAIPMDKKGKGKSKKEKAAAASDADELTFQTSGKRGRGQGMSVMDVETAGFYQPKTRDTRQAYDLLLSVITSQFGDQPQDVLRGAADEVLAVLKNDKLKDPEKEKEVNELLGSSSSEQFATLVQIGKRITDYTPEGLREEEAAAAAAGLDKDLGVAVEFEDEEEEEEDGEHVMEEVESDPDSEDEGVDGTEGGRALQANMDVEEGEEREGEELKVQEIDAYWLQRKLAEAMPELQSDEIASQRLADEVFQALQKEEGETFVETHLVELLGFQQFSLIKSLTGNRLRIVWCTRLARTQSDEERASVEKEMEGSPETLAILEALRATRTSLKERQKAREDKIRDEGRRLQEGEAPAGPRVDAQAAVVKERHRLDLDMLAFNSASSGGHFMPQGLKIRLPQGSFRKVQKGYEEVHVSAPKPPAAVEGEALKSISDIPDWAQPAFSGMKQLNRVQSKVYDTALFSSDNILLCAPTGAGKTNVAMLCMLHQIGLHRKSDGSIDTSGFKIVYVAPMKALVAEMVGNFGKRLEPFGIQVRELTGDMNLSKSQIEETQVIVTTPEKWDIITRKSGDRTYTNLVKLLIVDEVHLLHDDRGPVLESIVARTLRHIEATQEMTRLVGLSATLPNYEDVAAFLRVKPDKGLFHFGNHYRPCPLQQQYIGVTVKKPLQRFQLMNEICYEKVLEGAGKHQMLIFVHSRKETAKTAKFLKENALKEDHLMKFVRDDAVTREVLQSESEHCKSNELRDILPYGFAIHHAGMTRADRQLVEDLFADGHVQVLVSTATLAWGVNLPAHTVIIKGTQVYNPVQSRWDELSPLDVMQMLGRAGRPQYDSYGEGIIITSHAELQYYLSLFNEQLPIESQYVATIPDNLNAEIVLGTVQNLREAAHWLGYTYMYVRMMRNPTLYGVPAGEVDVDRKLMNRRLDLIHSAALALDQHKLIKYDRRTGNFQVTDLGRIASKFYVTHTTISVFNQHLKPTMGEIELLRLFSMADEFKYLIIREEEKLELAKLVDKVPVPVKEAVDEPTAKINVLLQAYVSNLKLEGLALVSDMVYVTQSAGRLMRCLFEVCLRRGWAVLAEKALALSKQVSKRMWSSATPLRQFGNRLSKDVLAKLEKKELAWDRFYDLSAQELGELIRMPKVGKSLHKHVHMFPRLELAAHVQPVTRSIIKIDLTLMPDFKWDPEVHGMVEPFWVICEDQDSEFILHSELFLLKSLFAEEEHAVAFTVPVQEPLPPQYYVKVVSDRWLNCQNVLPVSFRNLLLPDKFPPPTDLLDLQPLPVSALRNPEFEALYPDITLYNPIQTQVFTALYNTDDNCLVCAPTGSGKLLVAEFAVLRMIARARAGKGECRAVCMVPFDALAKERCADWRRRLGKPLGLTVELLTGEAQLDLKLLERGNLVVTTPENWDMLSRRWKQRAAVRKVALFICDEVHLLGGERGPAMEVTLARMRYISSEVKRQEPLRIVGLGASTANAKDLGDWLGASSNGLFNFPPSVRPVPLEIHIQAFDIVNFEARMQAMLRPTFTAVVTFTEDKKKPALVFSPTRKHARIAASELVLMAEAEKRNFLQCMPSDLETYLESVQDPRLRDCLQGGVGILHETQPEEEQQVVRLLFESGAIRVLVATAPMVWAMSLSAMLVVVMGTLYFDGSGVGHSNYPVTDLLQMMGAASRPGKDDQGVCVLMCHTARKEYYKKFLFEALPVESQLDKCLHDHFNAEIVTGVIANKQDAVDYLTWTFFYRRLPANPNFYNMTNRSHRHVSDHLSDLVENTLADLEQSKAIAIEDDMDVEALNLGMIAAYYYISYTTIERFAASLKPRTKLKGLLAILSAASEYETLVIRPGEDAAIAKILKHAPYAIENPRLTDPNCKANALLQAHFGRLKVAGDLAADQREVLLSASRLLQALVDVIASNGWLHPALAAMELSQMVTQGLSDRDSPLMQLPHFTRDLAARCQRAGIESIIELLEMQDDARSQLLALTDRQLHDVASFCNRYPEIDLTLGIEEGSALEATAGENTQLVVLLERQLEEDLRPVDAPRFPKTRDETWWLVIGDPEANTLLAIKKVSLQKKQKVKVAFQAPSVVGKRKLMLYFMCDAYMGCDQEYDFMIDIKADADADDHPDDDTMDQD